MKPGDKSCTEFYSCCMMLYVKCLSMPRLKSFKRRIFQFGFFIGGAWEVPAFNVTGTGIKADKNLTKTLGILFPFLGINHNIILRNFSKIFSSQTNSTSFFRNSSRQSRSLTLDHSRHTLALGFVICTPSANALISAVVPLMG